MVRAFIAVEISDEIRSRIVAAVEPIQRGLDGIKWVDRENLHLTLRFLGEIEESDVELLQDIMKARFSGAPAPLIHVRKIGNFPRVIWAGIEGDLARLRSLWERAQTSARELGLGPDDHGFSPHVTIARIKESGVVTKLKKRLEPLAASDFGAMTVNRVVLFQSRLSPHGPTYAPLFDVLLPSP
jgi:2'-5' RNA ligase